MTNILDAVLTCILAPNDKLGSDVFGYAKRFREQEGELIMYFYFNMAEYEAVASVVGDLVLANGGSGVGIPVLRMMYISTIRSIIDYAAPVLMLLRARAEKIRNYSKSSHAYYTRLSNEYSRCMTSSVPLVILNLSSKIQVPSEYILKASWGSASLTCHTLMIDLTADSDFHILRHLAKLKVWHWPDANILMVGTADKAKSATQHPALHNTIMPLYLGIEDDSIHMETEHSLQRLTRLVRLYIRCLYCNEGNPKTILLHSWFLGLNFTELRITNHDIYISDQFKDFQGHVMRVVSFPVPPHSNYTQSKDGPGGVVTMVDSFDKRLLDALSSAMNFTFEVRSPKDMRYGSLLKDGNWTGMMRAVYNNEADFTTIMGINEERIRILDLQSTAYLDQIIITSLKPQPLPQYLVFLRPFTGVTWITLIVSIMIWGSSLWFLQKMWSSFTRNKSKTFNEAIFYSWANMLEDPPNHQPQNITGQVLVGLWLIACFLISTGFKSSLVAHLTVEGKTRPIDTCTDLVRQDNWAWGIDVKILTEIFTNFFQNSPDADIRLVYKNHKRTTADERMKKALRGGYAVLSGKDDALKVISSKYTNKYGETPFHLGKVEYNVAGAIGWGFRKGAPFRTIFFKSISHVLESGISRRWIKQVHSTGIRGKRYNDEEDKELIDERIRATDDSKDRVIKMIHMTGVYLVLIVGLSVASVIFVVETITDKFLLH
ncbi:glutamate receptor 2-like [Palaemon carinicauda]|uniref:glutamate receptor 2-like n=1 Tax=Palaemon carinicauda TaxID=392227 RepID=UPI0035B60B57